MVFGVDNSTLALACLAVFAYLFRTYVQKNRELPKQPPGPRGLPLFGYILFIRNEPHVKLTQLKEKYGDIYSLKLGSRYVVVLNSEQTFREVGYRPEFLGRPKQSDLAAAPMDSPLFGNGKVWSEHRKFTFKVFRELETGSSMEENIKLEINCFVELIEKQKKKPVCPRQYLLSSISNYITRLCFGVRYNIDDPERKFIECGLNEIPKLITTGAVSTHIPWLNRIPVIRKILQTERLMEIYADFCDLIQRKVKEHRQTSVKGSPRDYLDYYLYELSSKESSQNTTFPENVIDDNVIVLYIAGSETISTTLEWCVYVMAAYPEVQERVQKEIDDIVGQDRTPSFSDLKNLHYTQAVLMEIHRWRTAVPINPKMTLEDCSIGGYHIPKDTTVFLNSWAVHHDPRYWKKPDDFIPERFLSPDGSSVIMDNKSYIPFGVGKRSCPGERIGIMQVFLYFTTILRKFKLKFPEGRTPDLTPIVLFTTRPKEQEVCFVRRVT